MSEQRLDGRTAIVTGASSGIGRAIAARLAAAGAHVYLVGRSEDALQEAKQAIEADGGKAAIATLDVRDAEAVGGLVQQAIAETGTLNIMVNNAGLSYPGSIVDGQPAHWREMFETNVIALLVGAQAAIRAMRQGGFAGHVVNISSIAGRMEGSGVYGSTKAAVNLLGQTLRQEVANDPIRIVQILPGAVATNFARNFPPDVMQNLLKTMGLDIPFQPGTVFPEEQLAYLQAQAAPFLASGDDVARAVLFAVTQPAELDVFEMVVRPARDIPF